ncbi:MAG: hypothetical protein CSA36_03190 [Draconibacterium sp.]|nr:MAG: hypothetical protein CSA36_03190 [Draconibacterium sp.]
MKLDYELEMQVRDYECDIQGIVNNAIYQHYLEHCRHCFLQSVGLDFARLHRTGIDPVVIRAEIDYKYPLRPGDKFIVTLKLAKQGALRLVFLQQIMRKNDKKLAINARITTVLTRNGKPIRPDSLAEKFAAAGIFPIEI